MNSLLSNPIATLFSVAALIYFTIFIAKIIGGIVEELLFKFLPFTNRSFFFIRKIRWLVSIIVIFMQIPLYYFNADLIIGNLNKLILVSLGWVLNLYDHYIRIVAFNSF